MREHDRFAGAERRFHIPLVNLRGRSIGGQNHDNVGPGSHVCDRLDHQAVTLDLGARFTGRRQTNANLHARVIQIQGMRMTL